MKHFARFFYALVLALAYVTVAPPAVTSAALVLHNGQITDLGSLVMSQVANPTVWDGTPATSNWKITQAVSEWNKRSAFDASMSPTSAATVRVTEVYDSCGVTFGTVLGCAYSDGTIHLNPSFADEPLAEHVGIHELGHTFGHGHTTVTRSVMRASVGASDWFRAPQPYDYAIQLQLYGR